jgi:hypothetical protein
MPVQDGRIHIEKINGPLILEPKARQRNTRPARSAIERSWLEMHERVTYVKFGASGAALFV